MADLGAPWKYLPPDHSLTMVGDKVRCQCCNRDMLKTHSAAHCRSKRHLVNLEKWKNRPAGDKDMPPKSKRRTEPTGASDTDSDSDDSDDSDSDSDDSDSDDSDSDDSDSDSDSGSDSGGGSGSGSESSGSSQSDNAAQKAPKPASPPVVATFAVPDASMRVSSVAVCAKTFPRAVIAVAASTAPIASCLGGGAKLDATGDTVVTLVPLEAQEGSVAVDTARNVDVITLPASSYGAVFDVISATAHGAVSASTDAIGEETIVASLPLARVVCLGGRRRNVVLRPAVWNSPGPETVPMAVAACPKPWPVRPPEAGPGTSRGDVVVGTTVGVLVLRWTVVDAHAGAETTISPLVLLPISPPPSVVLKISVVPSLRVHVQVSSRTWYLVCPDGTCDEFTDQRVIGPSWGMLDSDALTVLYSEVSTQQEVPAKGPRAQKVRSGMLAAEGEVDKTTGCMRLPPRGRRCGLFAAHQADVVGAQLSGGGVRGTHTATVAAVGFACGHVEVAVVRQPVDVRRVGLKDLVVSGIGAVCIGEDGAETPAAASPIAEHRRYSTKMHSPDIFHPTTLSQRSMVTALDVAAEADAGTCLNVVAVWCRAPTPSTVAVAIWPHADY